MQNLGIYKAFQILEVEQYYFWSMDFLKSQLNAWSFQQALSTPIDMGSYVSQDYSCGVLPLYLYSLVFSQRLKVSCSVMSTSL